MSLKNAILLNKIDEIDKNILELRQSKKPELYLVCAIMHTSQEMVARIASEICIHHSPAYVYKALTLLRADTWNIASTRYRNNLTAQLKVLKTKDNMSEYSSKAKKQAAHAQYGVSTSSSIIASDDNDATLVSLFQSIISDYFNDVIDSSNTNKFYASLDILDMLYDVLGSAEFKQQYKDAIAAKNASSNQVVKIVKKILPKQKPHTTPLSVDLKKLEAHTGLSWDLRLGISVDFSRVNKGFLGALLAIEREAGTNITALLEWPFIGCQRLNYLYLLPYLQENELPSDNLIASLLSTFGGDSEFKVIAYYNNTGEMPKHIKSSLAVRIEGLTFDGANLMHMVTTSASVSPSGYIANGISWCASRSHNKYSLYSSIAIMLNIIEEDDLIALMRKPDSNSLTAEAYLNQNHQLTIEQLITASKQYLETVLAKHARGKSKSHDSIDDTYAELLSIHEKITAAKTKCATEISAVSEVKKLIKGADETTSSLVGEISAKEHVVKAKQQEVAALQKELSQSPAHTANQKRDTLYAATPVATASVPKSLLWEPADAQSQHKPQSSASTNIDGETHSILASTVRSPSPLNNATDK